MINIKIICNNILNDSRLTSVIDEDSICDAYPEKVEIFPCVIYLDSGQNDTEFADNLPTASDISLDIHIFTKAEEGYPTTSEIGKIICDLFKEKYFTCTTNTEISDPDKTVKHRFLSFRNTFLET